MSPKTLLIIGFASMVIGGIICQASLYWIGTPILFVGAIGTALSFGTILADRQ